MNKHFVIGFCKAAAARGKNPEQIALLAKQAGLGGLMPEQIQGLLASLGSGMGRMGGAINKHVVQPVQDIPENFNKLRQHVANPAAMDSMFPSTPSNYHDERLGNAMSQRALRLGQGVGIAGAGAAAGAYGLSHMMGGAQQPPSAMPMDPNQVKQSSFLRGYAKAEAAHKLKK
jgi:hypothetical protein